jgi:hypothetical protein
MSTHNSAYEQILRLLPNLSEAEWLLLLDQLQRQVEFIATRTRALDEFQRMIDPAFGIWADRRDLPDDSGEYVHQLRKGWDERLTRVQGEAVDSDGSS